MPARHQPILLAQRGTRSGAQLRVRAAEALLRWPVRWLDSRRNARASGERRILVAHSALERPAGLRQFLTWTEANVPTLRQALEFQQLSRQPIDVSKYGVVAFWGGATLIDRAPWLFRAALELAGRALASGVATINSPDFWPNAIPTRAAKLLATSGLRTPRICALRGESDRGRDCGGLPWPVYVRDDSCRKAEPILARDTAELSTRWAAVSAAHCQRVD